MDSELRTIRQQMQADFKAIMSAFDIQRDAMAGSITRVNDELQKVNDALGAQQQILAGFMERTEVRFDRIVTVVEGLETWRTMVDDRLDALERKIAG